MVTIKVHDKKFTVDTPHFRVPFWGGVIAGSWEPDTFKIFDQYLKPDKTYIDIGAWIGPTVLYGAQLAKHCFAFEPDPVAFSELFSNISRNPEINNITLFKNAIAPTIGPIKIGAYSHYGDSMTGFFGQKETSIVPGITLEQVVRSIPDCNFVKMDIEGGEAMILPSAAATLRESVPTLFLSLHAPIYPNGMAAYFTNIMQGIGGYAKIYRSDGKRLSIEEIPTLTGFQSIVCTNV